MAFNYQNKKINILDTPGHKDFAEDTFRTLTAVDSVIVVIDVAKGVEEQTEKLVEVCRMRNIPMIVFINKLDREGKDAFDLLDEVEQKLGLKVCPMSFPIGMGYDFQGIYNLWERNIRLFGEDNKQRISETIEFEDLTHPDLEKIALSFEDRGALAATLKVGFVQEENAVKISMINPMYLFYGYFIEGIDKHEIDISNCW